MEEHFGAGGELFWSGKSILGLGERFGMGERGLSVRRVFWNGERGFGVRIVFRDYRERYLGKEREILELAEYFGMGREVLE